MYGALDRLHSCACRRRRSIIGDADEGQAMTA
jgi:hypothetical protein